MQVLLITGSLNQGGAQYQLLLLARLLRQHNMNVEVVAITDYDYYLPFIEEHKIPYSCVPNSGNSLVRLVRAVRLIKSKKPDVAISFIKVVSQVAILARVLSCFRFRLYISERTSLVRPLHDIWYFNIALLANGVTVNSATKYNYIRHRFPLLKNKTTLIPNLLDNERFFSVERQTSGCSHIRLSFVGRISPEKNLLNLISAAGIITAKGYNITLDIYGEARNKEYLKEIKILIKNQELTSVVTYRGPASDVTKIYATTDLLCLVSFYEGLSNVLAEAMAVGLPILASNIDENRHLVEEEANGYLVSPESYENIAEGIEKFLNSNDKERALISARNKARIKEIYDEERIFNIFRNIIEKP